MLTGPQGTPYTDGLWKLHLKIPSDYPKSPPKAAFKTKIYHPNVEESTGSVCLDTLKRDWQPKLTLRDILITISCLLINPNPDSALNSEAGKLLQEDFESFARKARLMTSIHARIPPNLRSAAIEARTRGEEKQKSGVKTYEAPDHSDTGEDDEVSASKENDPSISPSPVSPPPTIQPRRNTILGKRPLSDLPTPEEPPSDDESQTHSHLSASERNIAANTTPNLSGSFSSLSFANTSATSNEAKNSNQASHPFSFPGCTNPISSRPRAGTVPQLTELSPAAAASAPFAFTFTGLPTSSSITNANPNSTPYYDAVEQQPPSAKRLCSGEGKENITEAGSGEKQASGDAPKATLLSVNVTALEKPTSVPVGLGVKNVKLKDGPRKDGPRKGGSGILAKNKARVGLRRL